MQFVDQLLFLIGLINPLYNFMSYLNEETGKKDKCHTTRNNTPVTVHRRLGTRRNKSHMRIQSGGQVVATPPEKLQKYRVP